MYQNFANMGLCNILTLLLIFGSVPLWVIILNSYNYYHDYFGSFFEIDPPDAFDFIVGKPCCNVFYPCTVGTR